MIELSFLLGATKEEAKKVIEEDLKSILTGLARHLFGDVEMRWREDYFPFTEPSFELDIFFNGDWMEVLGCGVIHDEVMANAGKMPPDALLSKRTSNAPDDQFVLQARPLTATAGHLDWVSRDWRWCSSRSPTLDCSGPMMSASRVNSQPAK